MDSQALHTILDDACSQIALSHNTQVVRRFPDASAMVSRRDSAIGEVDDLVSVLELPNDLSLARHNPISLFSLFLRIVSED